MAISRPTITDDNGTGNTGTIGDAVWVDDFCSRIDAAIDGANATVRVVAKGGTGVLSVLAAVPISTALLLFSYRSVPKAEATMVERARAAGEPV